MRPLLKLAALERSHIRSGELEPFAIRPLLREPAMPIRLNPGRIVSANSVEQLDFLGQSDADLLDPFFDFVAAANLVVGFQINAIAREASRSN